MERTQVIQHVKVHKALRIYLPLLKKEQSITSPRKAIPFQNYGAKSQGGQAEILQ